MYKNLININLITYSSKGSHEARDLSVVLAINVSTVLNKQTNHIEVAPYN